MSIEVIYQRIGEFVVCFQWLENRFREIGWIILDPHRRQWPPTELRDETNCNLLNKVRQLFDDLIDRIGPVDASDRKNDFAEVVGKSHELRKYRNALLHSAFIELSAGEHVLGLLRSNPKLTTSPLSCETMLDQEFLTDEAIAGEIEKMAEAAIALSRHYIQLIHWAPFDETGG